MKPNEIEPRLKTVFSAVLDVPVEQVVAELSPQTCDKWDSLNQIHLVSAIEEEFGLEMDFGDQMRMLSFATALEIVAAGAAEHHTWMQSGDCLCRCRCRSQSFN